jgi:hypothetical protein
MVSYADMSFKDHKLIHVPNISCRADGTIYDTESNTDTKYYRCAKCNTLIFQFIDEKYSGCFYTSRNNKCWDKIDLYFNTCNEIILMSIL